MNVGILQLPHLMDTNAFSDQVAADELRPAVLAEELADFGRFGLRRPRVAVVPSAVGSDHAVLDQNIRIEFTTPQMALLELLSNNIDSVLLPPPTV